MLAVRRLPAFPFFLDPLWSVYLQYLYYVRVRVWDTSSTAVRRPSVRPSSLSLDSMRMRVREKGEGREGGKEGGSRPNVDGTYYYNEQGASASVDTHVKRRRDVLGMEKPSRITLKLQTHARINMQRDIPLGGKREREQRGAGERASAKAMPCRRLLRRQPAPPPPIPIRSHIERPLCIN